MSVLPSSLLPIRLQCNRKLSSLHVPLFGAMRTCRCRCITVAVRAWCRYRAAEVVLYQRPQCGCARCSNSDIRLDYRVGDPDIVERITTRRKVEQLDEGDNAGDANGGDTIDHAISMESCSSSREGTYTAPKAKQHNTAICVRRRICRPKKT
jgi:hypothetical protein